MGGTGERPPEGRYGREADARADRGLKIVGAVLGALFVAMVAWFGYDYVAGEKVSAEMIKFDVVDAGRVDVHLEVRKDDGAKGFCTVRALAESGAEVGRKEVRFDQPAPRVDEVITVRTTEHATAAELLGCTSD
ncbi:DUF4307 domain-containing protein [Streptomyces kanasensis]|uniref:DUF4307 domain-containing protein n=1 Tax=Streptomyces kanasensis TaxID=936756 RepID=UPI003819FFCE